MFKNQFANLPIEVVRSFVAVADSGSLSKAANRMGISQPAVSAQMKRLQGMVGGAIFEKTANGTTLTELGKLVLHQARRVLEALDQMLTLAGSDSINAPLRLGMSALILPKLLQTNFHSQKQNVFLFSDHSREIKKGLIEGYIDIACAFQATTDNSELQGWVAEQYLIPLAWARSKTFVLGPGNPLPIIALPEDDYMIRPLKVSGSAYKVVLHTPDMHARLEAVRAGLGICAVPVGAIPADLVVAQEYYLPKLEPINACVFISPKFDRAKAIDVLPYIREALRACANRPDDSRRKQAAI
jgi:DNA-binding transcriptional LysR family regulator